MGTGHPDYLGLKTANCVDCVRQQSGHEPCHFWTGHVHALVGSQDVMITAGYCEETPRDPLPKPIGYECPNGGAGCAGAWKREMGISAS
jgi:hypothetical protein